MVIGTVDNYNFEPLSVTLTLTWGHMACKAELVGFIFDPYECHMDLCNELCSSGQLACVRKTLDITHELFNQSFFIPAMLTGTINFYHFIPLSLTLTLPEGHKVSAKQNLLASFSPTFYI